MHENLLFCRVQAACFNPSRTGAKSQADMATPAYVLLTEEEYHKVRNACTLSSHNVGGKEGSKSGFLIFMSMDAAYAHARKTYVAGQQVAPAPDSTSIWRSLTMYFTHAQWVAHLLPMKEEPLLAVEGRNIRVRSDLSLEGVSTEIQAWSIGNHSVEEWADARLHKRRRVTDAECGTCGRREAGRLARQLRKPPAPQDS